MGLLVVSAPFIVGAALLLLLAISFAIDGLGYVRAAWRAEGQARTLAVLGAAGDLGAAVLLLLTHQLSHTWVVSIAASLRMAGIAWTMAVTPILSPEDARQTVLDDLGLADYPDAVALAAAVAAEETARVSSDRRWTLAFLVRPLRHPQRANSRETARCWGSRVAGHRRASATWRSAILFTLVVVVPIVVSAPHVDTLAGAARLALVSLGWRAPRRGLASHCRKPLAALPASESGMRLREARSSVPAALWRSLSTACRSPPSSQRRFRSGA